MVWLTGTSLVTLGGLGSALSLIAVDENLRQRSYGLDFFVAYLNVQIVYNLPGSRLIGGVEKIPDMIWIWEGLR
jgi:hypothetical protein